MLTLPATVQQVYSTVWVPALAALPARFQSPEADVMGLAIGGQESGYRARVQANNGPAHSFWQMEEFGGVRGVMLHPATQDLVRQVCAGANVPYDRHLIWLTMATQDELGAQLARLLLWTSPTALPAVGEADAAWDYYVDLWRPGKPDKTRWAAAYQAAVHVAGER